MDRKHPLDPFNPWLPGWSRWKGCDVQDSVCKSVAAISEEVLVLLFAGRTGFEERLQK